jgi:hypothetical protein
MTMKRPEIKATKLFIDNEFVDAVSGKTFATVNPATEKEICQASKYICDSILPGTYVRTYVRTELQRTQLGARCLAT